MRAHVDPFEEMAASFAEAAALNPEMIQESFYVFASRHVRIRSVGFILGERNEEAFAHLRSGESASKPFDLTIDLWDVMDSGITGPRSSGVNDGYWAFDYLGGNFTGSEDGRFMGYLKDESAAWLDRRTHRIVGWHASAQNMPLNERSKPLLLLLSVWYNDHHVQTAHAALVACQGRGVLFPGPGGSGKTTAALACVHSGFQFLGDDYVGLQHLDDKTFVGHSLYNSVLVVPDLLLRLPKLTHYAVQGYSSCEEKPLVPLAQVFPAQIGRSVSIRLVVLPRVVDSARSRIHHITKGHALLRFACSSIQIPSRGKAFGMDNLGELLNVTPAFWLDLGRDPGNIPKLIADLLDGRACL